MIVLNSDRCVLFNADALDALKILKESSIDSVVTDPPYELGFMGKSWDASGIAYSVELWRLVLRVLKPGGHMLAFGATRTYHRMACAIEDSGFEIRDSLHWFYGTGFPKSLNLGNGLGTALKPGHEPIVMARKPLIGTVAANLAAHGTGGLNIDESRIAGPKPSTTRGAGGQHGAYSALGTVGLVEAVPDDGRGRWPANVLLDEGAAADLDDQSGERPSSKGNRPRGMNNTVLGAPTQSPFESYGGTGGASRFFYVAKAGRKERDEGCEALECKTGAQATDRAEGSIGTENPRAGAGRTGGARNFHPTVKPVTLMAYLVNLITPVGGIVLDPFVGSGSTGVAALAQKRNFVGIEKSEEYLPITLARLNKAMRGT